MDQGERDEEKIRARRLNGVAEEFAREYYATLSGDGPADSVRHYYRDNSILLVYDRDAGMVGCWSAVGADRIAECVRDRLHPRDDAVTVVSATGWHAYGDVIITVTGITAGDRRRFTRTAVLHRERRYVKTDVIERGGGGGGECAGRDRAAAERRPPPPQPSPPRCLSPPPPPPPDERVQLTVSGLPASARPHDVRWFFEQRYGPVVSVRLMRRQGNYGFVTYETAESARRVMRRRWRNSEPVVLLQYPEDADGTTAWLVVKRKRAKTTGAAAADSADPRRFPPADRQLFVGDIPDAVTETDLRRFFSAWGPVAYVRIMSAAKKGDGCGVCDDDLAPDATVHGFVTFATPDGARAALADRTITYGGDDHGGDGGHGVPLTVAKKIKRTAVEFARQNSNRGEKSTEKSHRRTRTTCAAEHSILVCF